MRATISADSENVGSDKTRTSSREENSVPCQVVCSKSHRPHACTTWIQHSKPWWRNHRNQRLDKQERSDLARMRREVMDIDSAGQLPCNLPAQRLGYHRAVNSSINQGDRVRKTQSQSIRFIAILHTGLSSLKKPNGRLGSVRGVFDSHADSCLGFQVIVRDDYKASHATQKNRVTHKPETGPGHNCRWTYTVGASVSDIYIPSSADQFLHLSGHSDESTSRGMASSCLCFQRPRSQVGKDEKIAWEPQLQMIEALVAGVDRVAPLDNPGARARTPLDLDLEPDGERRFDSQAAEDRFPRATHSSDLSAFASNMAF
ncbi:hypothetical protein RRG08_034160 [Elysia crispata]|uniref:Uncharacterized protein n=1 Tax=Elysia crispata TaxID=231223 RepID=A0AAE0ZL04_9GAST|nr:hypothetical protein RRG08_034160 [Elysia crispata]